METKEIKINIPEGYEVDKENSTFECIKFKKKIKVNTWQDIPKLQGFYTLGDSKIVELDEECHNVFPTNENRNVFLNKKYLKSALALAQISQLMPYYGGEVTNEEWEKDNYKYSIDISNGKIYESICRCKHIVAFHTKKQLNKFLSFPENVQLIKDLYMID